MVDIGDDLGENGTISIRHSGKGWQGVNYAEI